MSVNFMSFTFVGTALLTRGRTYLHMIQTPMNWYHCSIRVWIPGMSTL